jgi:hypothetical protein
VDLIFTTREGDMVETTIIQQLNTLSLEQLREVKKTVNTLIRSKRRSKLSRGIDLGGGSYSRSSSSKLPAEQYYSQLKTAEERAYLFNAVNLAVSTLRQINNSSSRLEPSAQELTTESVEKLVDELVDKIEKIFVTADSPVPEKESESLRKESESLRELIGFVDEWMSDESGYDETTYPQIEAALQKNQLSL